MENRDDFDNKSKNIKNRKTLKPLREHTGNLKEKNGITMVALVVTIVVLLILSTITIQGITHTGLFSSAEKAKLDHKRAYIATTLETKLKISQSEQIRGTDEEIIKATYEDVKNDLDEIKKAGGKDIEVGEVTSEEREGKTEWFFEVKVDGDVYKVALDGSDYLGKENELSPLIQIKTVKSTTNTISVSVTTKRNEGGKVEYYIKEKAASKFTLAKTTDQNEYTYTGLKQDTTFVIKAIAIGKNGKEKESKEVEIETSTVPKIDSKEIEFAVEPNTWTNKSVKVTAKPKVDTQGFTLVTSKNPTSSWTKVDNQTFSTNGTMYVALTDGNNYGVTASHEVTNIDKIKPVITGVTATTNTIKITATDEASGICAYAISESSTMPTKFTVVDSTKIFNKIIENKKQSTKYYVWVKDQAGNVSEVASTTTGTVAGLTDANTTFSKTPNDWTNKDVTVTASTTEKNFALQTKKDNGEWQTTGTQTFTENGTIYARLWDGINAGAETKLNVTNIDKLAPNAFTPKATVTTNSIKVDGTTTDATATSTNGSSGIKEYRFSKDGGKTYTNAQTSATYTFSRLTQNVEYTIVVEAKDNAGNTTTGTVKATTGTVPTASGATYTPNTWTSGKVTVTLPTKNGYSTVYTTNGTTPTKDSTKYSAPFTVSGNCKINYLYTDGTNIGGAGTVNVTNIDKLVPNAFTPKATVTTNSIKVDGTTTDAQATSTNGSSGIKEYRFSKDGGKTYTNAQTSATYTFSGLTQKVEYTIVVEAKDNAGNTTTGTVKATTGTVPTASGATYTPNTWTKGNVTVTLPTKNGYSTVYTTNGTTPTKDSTKYSAPFTVSGNCKINYLYTDGTNIGGAGTVNVTNIDKLAPNAFTPKTTVTTNSIKVDGTTTDATATSTNGSSGIKEYRFSKDGGKTYTNAQTSATYTFSGLTQKVEYTIVVEAKDNAGNTITGTVKATTGTVPTASGATYTPTTWTKGNVTVTLPTKSGYSTVYTTNGTAPTVSSTKYSSAFAVSTNCKINYLYTDGTNIGGAGTVNVTNIDTANPVINTAITGSGTTSTIKLSMAVSDTQSGVNKIIWYYKLSTDSTYKNATDTYTATTANTTRTHTFTGLTQNKTYNAYAVVYDATGRTTQSTTINVTTGTVPTASGATYTPNTWTKGNVTVTLPTKSGYTTVYTTNGTAPTKSSTKYSAAFTVSNNCKINYLYTDGTNIGGAGTVNVTNIDTANPVINTAITGSGTTSTIKLSMAVSDTQSGVNKIIWYYKLSTDSTYKNATDTYTATTANTTRTHTFTGLTQNKTYNAYAVVYDATGRTTQSTTINVTTGTVPTASGATYTPNTWTKGNVTVTLPTKSGYTTVYTTNGTAPTKSSTKYSAAFTVSNNCKINYLYTDGTNIGGAGTVNVTNIDTANPVINTAITGSGTTSTIKLSMAVSDTQSGVNKIIWYYKLSTDSTYKNATDTYTATTANTTRTHTFTGLIQNKTYNVYAEIYDAVGNKTTSTTININTGTVPTASGATYTPSTWTNGNVSVTLPTKSGYSTLYTTNGTIPTLSSNQYTSAITAGSNSTIYYVFSDGINIGGTGAININNIDKIKPEINISNNETSSSAILEIKAADNVGVKSIVTSGGKNTITNAQNISSKELEYNLELTDDGETKITVTDIAGNTVEKNYKLKFLFKQNDERTAVTGGWKENMFLNIYGYIYNVGYTKNNGLLTITAEPTSVDQGRLGTWYTNNSIDFTGYDTIRSATWFNKNSTGSVELRVGYNSVAQDNINTIKKDDANGGYWSKLTANILGKDKSQVAIGTNGGKSDFVQIYLACMYIFSLK
ncbi:MAG: chitobiase/beta-hexosaminidase C-terminal domain-containing protein [Clostridia bacterium]